MSPFLSCVCTPWLLTLCSITFLAHKLLCFYDKQLIWLDLSFTLLLTLVLLFSLSLQFRLQLSPSNSCANMARGIEMMGRLGIASWGCWDKPFLTVEGLAAAWYTTAWWGNGCNPCPKVKVKVKREQKFKCSGILSSAGGVCFGFPLQTGLCCLLSKWPMLVTLGVLQQIWSDQSLGCRSRAWTLPSLAACSLSWEVELVWGLYCKPLFSSDWHVCHYVMIGLKILCVIFVSVIFIGLI